MIGSNPCILLADDAVDDLEMYSEALSRRCLRVVTAADGMQALEKALVWQPSAIVLDVGLPDIDGIEVCCRLRAAEPTRNIPVIFLSAYADPFVQTRARAAGGVSFLVKPCLPQTLIKVITSFISNARRAG
jgi:CheY-like chemotaxis protein